MIETTNLNHKTFVLVEKFTIRLRILLSSGTLIHLCNQPPLINITKTKTIKS